ncbi:MAG TPA: hypothetical protein VN873_19475 [Candidatus Angelobacter sp.]|nr:hypothetical protein [Candidatus Angelobacter sp.]
MAAFLFRRLLQGPRVQSAFLSRLGRGKATSKTPADEITQGQHISLELTANQGLEIQRTFEILAPLNIPLDVAANRYAQAI